LRVAILKCDRRGRRVVLSGEHVVGRLESCALRLEAPFVSSAHALIRWTGGGWEVRDLGSRNGTYVDGERLGPGCSARLSRGVNVAFGDAAESWSLICDMAPTAVALPVDEGEPSFSSAGLLAIPSPSQPFAMIYLLGEHWMLEHREATTVLRPGEEFEVEGRHWRFECPAGAMATLDSVERSQSLDEATLELGVSRDEEHVTLTIRTESWAHSLGERTGFYLLLLLARQRLQDRRTGDAEHGWIDIGILPKLAPEYASHSSLNVEVHRLRRLLAVAGIRDAARLIERRRGQIRLGTDRVELLSAHN
jgi:FHA domain-containing protein